VKYFFYLLLLKVSLFSANLILISNSTEKENLKTLMHRYKTDIIINDNQAYIIPEKCRLVRYFGGLSQSESTIVKTIKYTSSMKITEDIFEAVNEEDIEKHIQKQKITDLVEGKVAKEFLEDTKGHLLGGLSETPLDLSKQKILTKEINNYKSPSCKLLEDGSGYKLYVNKSAKLYTKDGLKSISQTVVLFD